MPFSIDLPPFVAHPLLRTGHAQTILGSQIGAVRPRHGVVQHEVPTDDGDRLVLHDDAPDAPGDQRIALLIHGLGGCHASHYLQRLSQKLIGRGIHPVRIDQRGCGTGESLARHMAHAGRKEDIQLSIRWLTTKYPAARITACGFSLGASVLLKSISASLPPPGLDSVIAVSPPLDLADCSARVPWFYNRYYARRLWRFFLRRRDALHGADRLQIPRPPRSILEFDRWITAPLNGFDSVEAYYRDSSVGQDLPRIDVPTVILMADDDPIVPADGFDRASLSSQTSLIRCSGGGHLGFVAAKTTHPRETDLRWMEWRIVDWICDLRSNSGASLAGR